MAKLDSLATQQNDEHKVFDTAEEQILHRPGQWIGSKQTKIISQYIFDGQKLIERETESNQALAKLVEEVIINSADEHVRTKDNPKLRGWVLDEINVTVRPDGHITVRDNGGINTGFHSKGPRVVELIFGNLFSSSNYDDNPDKKRKTVGTNGVGASLANLFSKRFTVETADGKNKLVVNWSENKTVKDTPICIPSGQHFTQIDYELELQRFGLKEIPFGIIKLLERLSAAVAAANPGLKVIYNDRVFKFNSFSEYVKLYGDESFVIENNAKWQLIVAPTMGLIEPRTIGIVNGAECHKGTHVEMAKNVINRLISNEIKNNPDMNVLSANKIASSYSIYIKMDVENPEYTAQNKDELSTELFELVGDSTKKRWYTLSKQFEEAVIHSNIFTYLKQLAVAENAARNSSEFKKAVKEMQKKKPASVEKLIDATDEKAEGRELWLFEGASAGSAFRPCRIPQIQGAYLLKGKMKNVTRKSSLEITKNQEISDLMIALGLNPREPDNLSNMRYDKVVFCTDMDYDGYCIFGQGYSLFAVHFPEVIRQGRLYRAITPLWKAVKGKEVLYFYSNDEYDAWSATKPKGYDTSYFKGLGSLEKDDYKMILKGHTRLEQVTLTDESMNRVDIYLKKEGENKKELKNILRSS